MKKNQLFELILKVIFKMQNVTRWVEFAPHFKDNAASHSFRIAAYSVLVGLMEENRYKNKIDKESLVCRGLFHDLNETVTGSIKHVTKKDTLVREHIVKLEKEASEKIVSTLPVELRPVFNEYITNAEDETKLEGRIIEALDTFDAMLFCHRETEFSSNKFFHNQFKELRERLNTYEIDSIQWLVSEFDKREGVYEFLMSIMMMDTIDRWEGKFNMVPDDDSTHTFRTSALSALNGYVKKLKSGVEIDIFSLVGKTIFHDLVEAETGDILGPVKHSTPEIKSAFEEYEKSVSKRMINKLPKEISTEMTELMLECKNNTIEGKLVDISDKVDALNKSGLETEVNQGEYMSTYFKQYKSLERKFGKEELKFLMSLHNGLVELSWGAKLKWFLLSIKNSLKIK